MTWEEAEAAFLAAMRDRRRPLTLHWTCCQLRSFREFSGLETPGAVQPYHLQQYLAAEARRVHLKTAWGYLFRLSSFFRWAARRQLVLWDPAKEIRLRVLNATPAQS